MNQSPCLRLLKKFAQLSHLGGETYFFSVWLIGGLVFEQSDHAVLRLPISLAEWPLLLLLLLHPSNSNVRISRPPPPPPPLHHQPLFALASLYHSLSRLFALSPEVLWIWFKWSSSGCKPSVPQANYWQLGVLASSSSSSSYPRNTGRRCKIQKKKQSERTRRGSWLLHQAWPESNFQTHFHVEIRLFDFHKRLGCHCWFTKMCWQNGEKMYISFALRHPYKPIKLWNRGVVGTLPPPSSPSSMLVVARSPRWWGRAVRAQ